MSEKLPSMAGRKVLLNIAAGQNGSAGLRSMAAHGGHAGTMVALRRRGLIDGKQALTAAGQQMLERLVVAPEVDRVA